MLYGLINKLHPQNYVQYIECGDFANNVTCHIYHNHCNLKEMLVDSKSFHPRTPRTT